MATRTVSDAGGVWTEAGTWVEGAVPTVSDDVVWTSTSGNVSVVANATCNSLDQSGATGGNGVLTLCSGTYRLTVAGNCKFLAGKLVAQSDSTLWISGAGMLTPGGNALCNLTVSGTSVQLAGNITMVETRVATLSVYPGCELDLKGYTVSGNSAANRLLVRSYTIGSTTTITTSTAGSGFGSCDFMDVLFANGGSNLDLSAITGLSGDCGGNAMSGGGTLTLTTPQTCTWKSTSGGSWSDAANWTTSGATDRVPLPQDTVAFSAIDSGQTIVIDMPRIGGSVSFAGASNSLKVVCTDTGITCSVFGSLNLTCVASSALSRPMYFRGRANATLTSNGNTFRSQIYIQVPGYTLTAADAVLVSNLLQVDNGTLATSYSVLCSQWVTTAGSTTNMGDGIWAAYSASPMNIANSTVNCQGSTLALTYAGATAGTVKLGTNTYNAITMEPRSGVPTVSGAFTCASLTAASAGAFTVKFTKSTTYTVTGAGASFLGGTPGALVTITSDDAANTFTLSKSGAGTVTADYLAIDYCAVNDTTQWYAGAHSSNGGHNGATAWKFGILAQTVSSYAHALQLDPATAASTYGAALTLVAASIAATYAQTLEVPAAPAATYGQALDIPVTAAATYGQSEQLDAVPVGSTYGAALALDAASTPGTYAHALEIPASTPATIGVTAALTAQIASAYGWMLTGLTASIAATYAQALAISTTTAGSIATAAQIQAQTAATYGWSRTKPASTPYYSRLIQELRRRG